MSPFLAVSMLTMAVKRNTALTDAQYDEAHDALVELLESANNQRFPEEEPHESPEE